MTPVLLNQDTLTGCLYGRNSNGEEKSIEDQLAEGREDADAEGIRIPDEFVYSDGLSASWYGKKTRDEWARVLDDVEHRRWDVLILWEASRGDRSPESWAYLIKRCREQGILIRIIRDEETLDPRKPGHLKRLLQDGLDSLFESVKTSERVQKGIRGAMKAGTPLGRKTYGYTRTRGTDGKVTGQLPDEHAPVVAAIFERLERGVPLTHVTKWLNAEGFLTSTGKPWTNNNVRSIARTPTYAALRKRKDKTGEVELVAGGWEAIVPEDRWYTVQRILDGRARKDAAGKRSRPARLRWLLSGIGRCGVCGAVIKAEAKRGMYVCSGVGGADGKRGCVGIKIDDLDQLVTRTVLAVVSRDDVYERLRKANEVSDREVQESRDEVARLTAKLDEARARWVADRISLDDYEDMAARLKPLIKAAQTRAEAAGVDPALRQLLGPAEDVAERWEAMPLASQREAIRALMSVRVDRSFWEDGYLCWPEERVEITPV